MNSKQLEVIARIKSTVEENTAKISLIQGPPGTGKSQVIVNIVASLIVEKSVDRILVCAHSNQAIDEVVSRLLTLQEIFHGKLIIISLLINIIIMYIKINFVCIYLLIF